MSEKIEPDINPDPKRIQPIKPSNQTDNYRNSPFRKKLVDALTKLKIEIQERDKGQK